jgi:acetyltransferase-like isoleucine patch superfamily enzyme
MDLRTMIRRAMNQPGMALMVARALLRGYYYKAKFRLLRRRVVIGRHFRVVGPLDIRGPGTVIFGDNCIIMSSRLHPTTPYTHAKDAVLRFGNGVILAGTRIGCQGRIDIEDMAEITDARIMDTDFHKVDVVGYRANTPGSPRPIRIGRNTWIGTGSYILKGVTIGEGSVVGAASVVSQDVPPHVIVAGNPARIVGQLKAHMAAGGGDQVVGAEPTPVENHAAARPRTGVAPGA